MQNTKTEVPKTEVPKTEVKATTFEDLKNAVDLARISLNNKAVEKLNSDKSFSYEYNQKNLNLITVTKAKGYSVSYDKKTISVKFRREYINNKIRSYENIDHKVWVDIVVYVEDNKLVTAWREVIAQFENEYKKTFLLDKEE